jgi:BASS family bile acid:Na+ symporter
MQSSVSSSHHGRRGSSFQQNTNPAWRYPQRRAQSPLFLNLRSTRPYTPPPSSSSVQLALRSPHFQSQPPPPNKPTWTPSIALIPHPEIIDARTSRLPPLHCGVSSNSYSTNGARSFRDWIELIGEAFPIWVALGCLLGLIKPSSFSWVQPKWTIVGITLTMLGMGMTLTIDDLRGALAMPKQLLSGFLLQYSVSFMLSFIFLSSKVLFVPQCYWMSLFHLQYL